MDIDDITGISNLLYKSDVPHAWCLGDDGGGGAQLYCILSRDTSPKDAGISDCMRMDGDGDGDAWHNCGTLEETLRSSSDRDDVINTIIIAYIRHIMRKNLLTSRIVVCTDIGMTYVHDGGGGDDDVIRVITGVSHNHLIMYYDNIMRGIVPEGDVVHLHGGDGGGDAAHPVAVAVAVSDTHVRPAHPISMSKLGSLSVGIVKKPKVEVSAPRKLSQMNVDEMFGEEDDDDDGDKDHDKDQDKDHDKDQDKDQMLQNKPSPPPIHVPWWDRHHHVPALSVIAADQCNNNGNVEILGDVLEHSTVRNDAWDVWIAGHTVQNVVVMQHQHDAPPPVHVDENDKLLESNVLEHSSKSPAVLEQILADAIQSLPVVAFQSPSPSVDVHVLDALESSLYTPVHVIHKKQERDLRHLSDGELMTISSIMPRYHNLAPNLLPSHPDSSGSHPSRIMAPNCCYRRIDNKFAIAPYRTVLAGNDYMPINGTLDIRYCIVIISDCQPSVSTISTISTFFNNLEATYNRYHYGSMEQVMDMVMVTPAESYTVRANTVNCVFLLMSDAINISNHLDIEPPIVMVAMEVDVMYSPMSEINGALYLRSIASITYRKCYAVQHVPGALYLVSVPSLRDGDGDGDAYVYICTCAVGQLYAYTWSDDAGYRSGCRVSRTDVLTDIIESLSAHYPHGRIVIVSLSPGYVPDRNNVVMATVGRSPMSYQCNDPDVLFEMSRIISKYPCNWYYAVHDSDDVGYMFVNSFHLSVVVQPLSVVDDMEVAMTRFMQLSSADVYPWGMPWPLYKCLYIKNVLERL